MELATTTQTQLVAGSTQAFSDVQQSTADIIYAKLNHKKGGVTEHASGLSLENRPISVYKAITEYVYFGDINTDEGVLCKSTDGHTALSKTKETLSCDACPNRKFTKEGKPKCTELVSFFGILHDTGETVKFSFSKTGLKNGKRLSVVLSSTGKAPWFTPVVLSSQEEKAGKFEWYTLVAQLADVPVSNEIANAAAAGLDAYRPAEVSYADDSDEYGI